MAMTVKELIEALQEIAQELSPDAVVIIQKDGEGNDFSPLEIVDGENNSYMADSTWSGRVKLTQLTPELQAQGFAEDDVAYGNAVPCVVLCPVN